MLRLRENGLFEDGKAIASAFAGFAYSGVAVIGIATDYVPQGATFSGYCQEQDGAFLQRNIMFADVATVPAEDETIVVGAMTYTFKKTVVAVPTASGAEIAVGGIVKEPDFRNGGSGWLSDSGWAYNATTNKGMLHTAGVSGGVNVGSVSQEWGPLAVVIGRTYTVVWTMSEFAAGTCTCSIGGVASTSARGSNASFTETLVAVSNDPLKFTPTYNFVGKIISVVVTDGVTEVKVLSAQNIIDRINIDKGYTACTAYNVGILGTKIALIAGTVANVSGYTDPTFTADGSKVAVDIGWSGYISEAVLEDIEYFKIDCTAASGAKEAIPTVLVERCSGTDKNFLY